MLARMRKGVTLESFNLHMGQPFQDKIITLLPRQYYNEYPHIKNLLVSSEAQKS